MVSGNLRMRLIKEDLISAALQLESLGADLIGHARYLQRMQQTEELTMMASQVDRLLTAAHDLRQIAAQIRP